MFVVCETCGKTIKRKPKDAKGHIYCCLQCRVDKDIEEYKKRFLETNKGYYLISYVNKNKVIIQCKKCGEIIETTSTNAIRRKCCDTCKFKAIEFEKQKKQEEKEKLLNARKELNELERELKELEKRYKRIVSAYNTRQNKKAERKRRELRREKRIKTNGKMDSGISIQRVYARDNGVCYLCGKRCDFSDHKITKEGYFIVGNNYPSIEHVIPLSKGGTHTWDNVRLAHMICNSLKNDTPPHAYQSARQTT